MKKCSAEERWNEQLPNDRVSPLLQSGLKEDEVQELHEEQDTRWLFVDET